MGRSYLREPLPTILGANLRTGTLWIAEVTLAIGICLWFYSVVTVLRIEQYNTGWVPLMFIPMVLGILKTIVGAFLFGAALMGKPDLMLPWILYSSLFTFLLGMTTLGFAFWLSFSSPFILVWIYVIIIGIPLCALMRYLILGVYSFYRQLKISSDDSSSQVALTE